MADQIELQRRIVEGKVGQSCVTTNSFFFKFCVWHLFYFDCQGRTICCSGQWSLLLYVLKSINFNSNSCHLQFCVGGTSSLMERQDVQQICFPIECILQMVLKWNNWSCGWQVSCFCWKQINKSSSFQWNLWMNSDVYELETWNSVTNCQWNQ